MNTIESPPPRPPPCPVTGDCCKHYQYQKDSFGEVAIDYCAHRDNPSETEGNCTTVLCPIQGIDNHQQKENNHGRT